MRCEPPWHHFRRKENMSHTDRRIDDDTAEISTYDAVLAVSGDSAEALLVLLNWQERDPMFHHWVRVCIDQKHLYDEQIAELYLLCDESLARFIYHVQMELPDQLTGEHRAYGGYLQKVPRDFSALRTHGKPGSFWALQSPPQHQDYSYPIV